MKINKARLDLTTFKLYYLNNDYKYDILNYFCLNYFLFNRLKDYYIFYIHLISLKY